MNSITTTNLLTNNTLPPDVRQTIHGFLPPEEMSRYSIALGHFGQSERIFPELDCNLQGTSVRLIRRQLGLHRTIGPIYHKTIQSPIGGSGPVCTPIPQNHPLMNEPLASLIKFYNGSNVTDDIKSELFQSMILKPDLSIEEKKQIIDLILISKGIFLDDPFIPQVERIGLFSAADRNQLEGLLFLAVVNSTKLSNASNVFLISVLEYMRSRNLFSENIPDDDEIYYSLISNEKTYFNFLKILAKNENDLTGYRTLLFYIRPGISNLIQTDDLIDLIKTILSNKIKTDADIEPLAEFFSNISIKQDMLTMMPVHLRRLANQVILTKNCFILEKFCNAAFEENLFDLMKVTFEYYIENKIYKFSPEYLKLLKEAVQNNGKINSFVS